jgi:ribulokinase
MSGEFVIGIDGGTESLRARVFDRNGQALGVAATSYETRFPAPARAEQDPEDWWRALVTSVRAAVADANVPPNSIAAMCATTTSCTVVALDAQARALRPSIIWMDVRANAQAEAVLATGDERTSINGAGRGPVSAEWMIPKALWLAENEPEVFSAAHTICEYQDFANWRLTGERSASLNNASVRWHYSSTRGGWPETLLEKLRLSALLAKWPSRVVAPGDVVGTLSEEAASTLRLPRGVKVVQGGADAFIGMIGLGVHKAGQIALITGSSHLQFGVSDREMSLPGLWGTYPDAVYAGRHIIEGGQTSTGSIIKWLGRLGTEGQDLARLNAEAASLPPGADGLLVLDHFQGNRTPHVDALSRGAITGLTLAHGMSHIFRAVLESISFGTRAIVDLMRDGGFPCAELTVGGGATTSALWMQIHADTANLPVSVPEVPGAPSLGAGILAMHGAGLYRSIEEGIGGMVRPGTCIEPIPENVARYEDIYQSYRRLYPALRPLRAECH